MGSASIPIRMVEYLLLIYMVSELFIINTQNSLSLQSILLTSYSIFLSLKKPKDG